MAKRRATRAGCGPRRVRLSVIALLCVAPIAGCSEHTVRVATDAVDPDRLGDASTGTVASDAAPAVAPTAPSPDGGGALVALCGTEPCACSDGMDNDSDGQRDGADPECTGPFDDDEATFGTGMEGSSGRCRDCFFDNNNSTVDDGCSYHRDCLTGTGSGDGRCGCDVSDACVTSCQARTPNGCDCFGCCEVQGEGERTIMVQLTDSCAVDVLTDPERCPPCVRAETCVNPCGPCEVCPGRSVAQFSSDCGEGGLVYRCDDGQVCGAGRPCEGDSYCLQGCCIPVVF